MPWLLFGSWRLNWSIADTNRCWNLLCTVTRGNKTNYRNKLHVLPSLVEDSEGQSTLNNRAWFVLLQLNGNANDRYYRPPFLVCCSFCAIRDCPVWYRMVISKSYYNSIMSYILMPNAVSRFHAFRFWLVSRVYVSCLPHVLHKSIKLTSSKYFR